MKQEFHGDSWIVYVTYDSDTKVMTVQTKVATYECEGVSQEVYDAFDRAPSRGKYFNENIKGKYMNRLFK